MTFMSPFKKRRLQKVQIHMPQLYDVFLTVRSDYKQWKHAGNYNDRIEAMITTLEKIKMFLEQYRDQASISPPADSKANEGHKKAIRHLNRSFSESLGKIIGLWAEQKKGCIRFEKDVEAMEQHMVLLDGLIGEFQSVNPVSQERLKLHFLYPKGHHGEGRVNFFNAQREVLSLSRPHR